MQFHRFFHNSQGDYPKELERRAPRHRKMDDRDSGSSTGFTNFTNSGSSDTGWAWNSTTSAPWAVPTSIAQNFSSSTITGFYGSILNSTELPTSTTSELYTSASQASSPNQYSQSKNSKSLAKAGVIAGSTTLFAGVVCVVFFVAKGIKRRRQERRTRRTIHKFSELDFCDFTAADEEYDNFDTKIQKQGNLELSSRDPEKLGVPAAFTNARNSGQSFTTVYSEPDTEEPSYPTDPETESPKF